MQQPEDGVGTVDEMIKPQWFQILLSVADRSLHGAAIMEEVLERTDGAIRLWPGALYGSLAELAEHRWIRETPAPEGAPTEGGRRRFWSITPAGRKVLQGEAERMAAYVDVARAKRVLRGRSAV
jgi:DNA-binding PadR family transcriptional regulator